MASFEELKKKARETAEVLADVSVELYKAAEEKAKVTAKKAKLNAEISAEKTAIKKLYLSIGANYYSIYKDSPMDTLAQACMEVTATIDRIEMKKAELEALKNNAKCDCTEEAAPESDSSCDVCCCEETDETSEASEPVNEQAADAE